MSANANRREEWEQTIRAPAEHSKEGRRRFVSGVADVEYQTAPLPDGRWAVRLVCRLEGDSSMTVPWRGFPTREDAVAFFREQALAFFERAGKLSTERAQARSKIVDLLNGDGLFGFAEPEPEREGDAV